MNNHLNILILEDVESDAVLMEYQLRKADFNYTAKHVKNETEFKKNIKNFSPDMILSDYNLPDYSGMEALETAVLLRPDTPFIFVTGALDERTVVDFIMKGAWDYVLKENLIRLIPAIKNAVKLKKEKDSLRQQKDKFEALYEEYQIQNEHLHKIVKKLADSRKDLKSKIDIINRSPIVTFSWENKPGWPVHYVSENAENIFGYPADDFMSGKINYIDVIHPDDIERVTEEVEINSKIKNKNRFSHKSYRIKTKNNEIKWVNDDTVIIKEKGKIVKFEGIINDVTDKVQKEETIRKLSTAIEQTSVSVIITDKEGKIEFANPKFEELTGYSLEEIMSKKLNILKSGEHNNEFYKDLWQTITNGKVWKGEFHNKKKNGELYWEDATISPVRNTKGKVTHFIALKEDITNKKLIQKRLIESEKHFREIFEKSLIGMYQTTPEGNIIRANRALYNMLGYNSFAELEEINLETEGYVNNRNKFKERIDIDDYVVGFESVWADKNGEPVYVRESARKYADEKGQIFYEGTIENITDWKLADKALKEMHSFNETIIKVGKLGYATYNINGKCLSANESYAENVGGTLDQIMVQNFRKIENWKKTGLLKIAEKCLKQGVQIKKIIEAESTFKKRIWIEIHLSRFYKEEEVQLLVILKDISSIIKAKKQQLQTKAEYINLIENVNVPVFGINKEGKINEWNTTIERLSGYKRDDIKGRNFVKHFIDKNEYNSYNFIKDSMTGIEISNIEFNLFTKKHKNLKLLVSTTIRRNIYNEIDGIICVGQDITEIDNYKIKLEKKVEERTHKLINALKKEKELGDLKSQFVSVASHEFRTPLSAIGFSAGFIKKYWGKLDNQGRNKKLEKIETQVKHMTGLLDDVLMFGKVEGGRIKINPKKINITEFLNSLIEEVQNVVKNSHKIKFDFQEICYIMIDEKVGRNIFTNLLTNAIKFSPDAGHVDLKLRSSDSEIIIEVIDYGIGINKEELEHIFTPFRRGKNVKTIQGTGLGLSIVKESVDLLKGTIAVESKIGERTKFTITLPKTV